MAHQLKGQTKRGQTPATQLLPETSWAGEEMPSGIPPQDSVVVTISRQFGSGGSQIGRLIAEDGGLNYLDNEIIAEVARRLGVEERSAASRDESTEGVTRHVLDAMQANQPFNIHYYQLLKRATSGQGQEAAYLHLTQKVVLELASKGNAVIVGRGAQFLLHHAPRTLHLYIFAPLPYRIENIMKEMQLSREQAEQLIVRRDYEHDNYLRHYYGSDGHQPGLYHLLVNTSLFSFEMAADVVRQALPLIKKM